MKKLLGIFLLVGIIYIAYKWLQPGLTNLFLQTTNSTTQISTITIDNQTYKVEISDTDAKRVQGLSGKKSLESNQGMLFVFDTKDRYAFWMKDMLFPLDFVWIDGNTVVDLTENVPIPVTATYLPKYQPKSSVDKILEINAGEIKKHGFKIGDKATFTLLKDSK